MGIGMTNRRHPHEGRLAEVYRREMSIVGLRFIWIGYVADHPPQATWDESLQGWILDDVPSA
jgi:hypothetical protein